MVAERAHRRVPLSAEVTLESDHNFYAGITDNVSEGGIFVALDPQPAVGTEVDLELKLGEETYKIHGEVRWVRTERIASEGMPAGCGVKWIEISAEALAAIRRFTEARETLFYED